MRSPVLLALAIVSLLLSSFLSANELEQAYQREFAYLVAEKEALTLRLKSIKDTHNNNLAKLTQDIDQLEASFLQQRNIVDRLNRQIVDASRDVDFSENDSLLLETTLIQALESLKKNDLSFDESAPNSTQLEQAFALAKEVIAADDTIQKTSGEFFAADGALVEGELFNVGRIARYGYSGAQGGALSPAGDGLFRVWEPVTLTSAAAVAGSASADTIDVFLFENAEKSIDKKEEKTFEAELEAGGLIAKIITALGVAGLILVVLRGFFLQWFSANAKSMTKKVSRKVKEGDLKTAMEICKKNKNSSASNVIAATLRNLSKDREHIEDIVGESILHETSKIDRFGTFILVIAAISPLLGLLGTVTGMISTFDIITEFGTGDPKLLSSGISEALITTKFGLIVAIPLLLLGNLLSGWANRIKNDLEHSALHVINSFKA